MNNIDPDTQIVTRLTEPWKFLFVDIDIAMLAVMIGAALVMSGCNTIVAMGSGIGAGYWLHKARQYRPRGFVAHLAYWWLPPSVLRLKRTPPMYCVRTVG
jgi:type IV conjugative transfer system protein TraL